MISFVCLQKHSGAGVGAAVVHLRDDGIGLRRDCNDGLQDCISLLNLIKVSN